MFFINRTRPVRLAVALTLAFFIPGVSSVSQDSSQPIRWAIKAASDVEIRAGGTFDALLVAAIAEGWYLYSPEQLPGGPLPTRIRLIEGEPFKLKGEIQSSPARISFDTNFNMETQIFEGEAVFTLPVAVSAGTEEGKYTLSVAVTFQSCNETTCLPARTVKLTADIQVHAAVKAASARDVISVKAAGMGEKLHDGLSEGMEVPEFSFIDFAGRKRHLSEFRGKYLLIGFWATWCKPCLAEIPQLKELYKKYQPRGFEILGMDSETLGQDISEVDPQFVKDTDERARQLIKTHGILWTQATTETAVPVAVSIFGIQSLPAKILLDREGKVVARIKESKELDAMLSTLVK